MTCNRCHEEEREGYGYGDDLKEFSWTVTEGTELLARAFCHEIDHLDGILYTEHVIGELVDTSQQN